MLKGVCTPICTPFKDSGKALDEAAFEKHLDWLIENGIHIIAVCGGTGEFPFLGGDEKKRIAEIAAKRINGRAKLIVQSSAIRTEDAIEFSKHAEGLGADALLILPPYFEGPGEDGVYYHYEQISKAVKTPIMVYNIPVHSGFDITPPFFRRLREIPTVKHIKDSTGNMMRIEQLVVDGGSVFNGCDFLMAYSLMTGGAGCFWGGSNVMPKQAVALYDFVAAGKLKEANDLWAKLKKANVFYWTTNFNAAIKASMQIIGRDLGFTRLPVMPLNEAEMKELREALATIG